METFRQQRLKRAIIKQEYVELTGDYRAAIVLNQFIYWSERVSDFDQFIDEENYRLSMAGQDKIEPRNGWIYKSAHQLTDECMLLTKKKVQNADDYKTEYVKDATVLSYIDQLIEKGWIERRSNPTHKWDRIIQYRVNLLKLEYDLLQLGYHIEGYKFPIAIDESQFQNLKMQYQNIEQAQPPENKNAFSKIENGDSSFENRDSSIEDRINENCRAIPETTTEITSEITNIENERPAKPDTSAETDELKEKKDNLSPDDEIHQVEPKNQKNPFDEQPKEAIELTIGFYRKVAEYFPNDKRISEELTPTNKELLEEVKEMERMNRIGPPNGSMGFTWDEIRAMLNYIYTNPDRFWATTIKKVRFLRDKSSTIQAQMKRMGGANNVRIATDKRGYKQNIIPVRTAEPEFDDEGLYIRLPGETVKDTYLRIDSDPRCKEAKFEVFRKRVERELAESFRPN